MRNESEGLPPATVATTATKPPFDIMKIGRAIIAEVEAKSSCPDKAGGLILCKVIARACHNLALKPEQLWRFLSPEDIDDLNTGLINFDTLRAYAERWNQHPYLVLVGNNLPFPAIPKQSDPETVTCKECEHFKPNEMGDGIGECSRGLIGGFGKPLYPNVKRHCDSFKKVTE